jgi:hypothetical protein
MTLRELVEDTIGVEQPLDCLLIGFQLLRTANQGEPATFDGCLSSIGRWLDWYGEATPANVRRWLDDLGAAAEAEFPMSFICHAIDVND